MKRILIISMAILRNWIRSRSGVFFSVLFPVMLLLIFATVFGGVGGSSKYLLYIQNLDVTPNGTPTNLSMTFENVLNLTDTFELETVPYDVDARSFVKDQQGTFGGTFRLLIIPSGFEEKLLNGSLHARLQVTGDTLRDFMERTGGMMPPEQKAGIEIGLAQLDAVTGGLPTDNITMLYISDPSNMASNITLSILANVASAFNYGIIGVESNIDWDFESVIESEFRVVDYYIPGLIGAFIMTNGIIGVTTNTTEFKRRGILKRFATTPLRRVEWVLGNVLTQTLLSFLLVFVMLGVGWVVFGVRAIPNVLASLLVIAGAFLFSGIGLILAGFITDVEAASAAGNAIAFPMMFLSGSFWPLEMVPPFMQTIARFLPLTYLSEGLRSALIFHNLTSTLTNLGIVAGLSVVFIIIGAAATRWHEH